MLPPGAARMKELNLGSVPSFDHDSAKLTCFKDWHFEMKCNMIDTCEVRVMHLITTFCNYS